MSYKSNIQNLQISSSGVVSGASTVETTNLGATNAVVGNLSTTLDASAALEVDSTTKGFLPPRVTTAQRNAISSPSEGLVVYNTDTDNLNFYSGSVWKEAVIDPTSNGLVVRTASGASSSRTITAGSGISVSNGNGVSGNPTVSNSGILSVTGSTGISVSAGQTPTITNTGILGITSGTGISVSGGQSPTITNTGLTTLDQIGSLGAELVGSYTFGYYLGVTNFSPGAGFNGADLFRSNIVTPGSIAGNGTTLPGYWRLMSVLTPQLYGGALGLFLRYA